MLGKAADGSPQPSALRKLSQGGALFVWPGLAEQRDAFRTFGLNSGEAFRSHRRSLFTFAPPPPNAFYAEQADDQAHTAPARPCPPRDPRRAPWCAARPRPPATPRPGLPGRQ